MIEKVEQSMVADNQEPDRIEELSLLVSQMSDRFDEMSQRIMLELRKISSPASTLGVQGKAEAIRKAMQTGDKKLIRQTMKEISEYN